MASADSKSSTMLLKTSKANMLDYSHLQTVEELGESLLNAAVNGDQRKVRKIIKSG
jgi:hypothetical protein